jgi:hypothetical protein
MKNSKKVPKAESEKHKHVSEYQASKNSKTETGKLEQKDKPKK